MVGGGRNQLYSQRPRPEGELFSKWGVPGFVLIQAEEHHLPNDEAAAGGWLPTTPPLVWES